MLSAFPLLLLYHFFALLAIIISPSSGSLPPPNAFESHLLAPPGSETSSRSNANDDAAYPTNASDANLPSCFIQPTDPSEPRLPNTRPPATSS